MWKQKFTPEKKIGIIEAYKAGKVGYSQLKGAYGMNPNEIYRWVAKYELHGIAAFQRGKGNGNGRYGREFKVRCVEEHLNGEGSLDDIAAKYNLPAKWTLQKWIMRYNANEELKDYNPQREVYMEGKPHRRNAKKSPSTALCMTRITRAQPRSMMFPIAKFILG